MQHLDTQLGRAGLHHGVDLLGHNQQRYPDRSQPLDTEPIGPADLHRLLTVLRDSGQVVGVDSVEVGDHCVDIDLLWRLDDLSQRARQGQIVQMVDIDCRQLWHLDDRRTPEEAMPRRPEPACRHDIERPRLAEIWFSILATGSYRRVMVLPGDQAKATSCSPQELIGCYSREDRIRVVVNDQLDASIKIIGRNERAGALDEDQYLRLLADHGQLVEGMQQRCFRRGGVTGQLGRSHDHHCTGSLRARGNLRVIGADVDLLDQPCRAACVDGALHQASPADPPEVLAGYALGAASRRNDRDNSRMFHVVCSVCWGRSASHSRQAIAALRCGGDATEEVVGLRRRTGLVPLLRDLADHDLSVGIGQHCRQCVHHCRREADNGAPDGSAAGDNLQRQRWPDHLDTHPFDQVELPVGFLAMCKIAVRSIARDQVFDPAKVGVCFHNVWPRPAMCRRGRRRASAAELDAGRAPKKNRWG